MVNVLVKRRSIRVVVGANPTSDTIAPIVEWLAHISDKNEKKVQFLLGVQKWRVNHTGCGTAC